MLRAAAPPGGGRAPPRCGGGAEAVQHLLHSPPKGGSNERANRGRASRGRARAAREVRHGAPALGPRDLGARPRPARRLSRGPAPRVGPGGDPVPGRPQVAAVTQAELLRHLVDALEAVGVEYMIGGSQASMYYGEPRLTRDVDVVVALRPEHLTGFLARFPASEFYVDEATAREDRKSTRLNSSHSSI